MKNALINIEKWVQQETEKPPKPFREAVHSILFAITNSDYLLRNMIIKGGMLLAIEYQSTRFTKDIDFSTSESYTEKKQQELIKELKQSLTDAVDILDYDLDCRVQSCKIQPANQPEPTFPSLKIKIGYAYIGTREHKRLVMKNASSVIDIDFNYNESLPHIEEILISEGKTILAYSLNDLIAEKYRAILQQNDRNRTRRQDIYDLHYLFQNLDDFTPEDKTEILETLILKAESRKLIINQKSMDNTKIRNRSKQSYNTIQDEILGELPDFDKAYDMIQNFYESLPWESN